MTQDRLRIDKWLWYARVTKSRSLAQKLATSGHVRLNREKIGSASQAVRVGDVLTLALERRVSILKIVRLGERRGPYAEACTLYEDLSPPPQASTTAHAEKPAPVARREAGAGRPTKRERRVMERFLHNGGEEGE